jgi:hypothetical protein
VANAENSCFVRFHPHLGHSGGSWLRVNTSFSKTWPQLEQAYSKMGMVIELTPWILILQLSRLEFPSREALRAGQAKPPIPAIRGRIANQTIREAAI